MRDELERLVAIGKLERRHVEPLVALHAAGYCVHRAWGCGKIVGVDAVAARLTIDFAGKPGHGMDLAFAAESLKPIPEGHILARKLTDMDGLHRLAATNHLELVRIVLTSFNGRATLDQVQQVLVPDVIRDDWKKWWELAKRALRKDGHFQVPVKKTDPILLMEQEIGAQDRLLADVRAAKGLKARVAAVYELLKGVEDLSDRQAAGVEVIQALNAEIVSHLKTMPGLALEGVLARDDVRAATGAPAVAGELGTADVWAVGPALLAVIADVAASKHARVLDSYRAARPDDWTESVLTLMNEAPAKVVSEMADVLVRGERFQQLKDKLVRLVSQHAASSDLLLWLARERSDAYVDVLGPEVFRAMMSAIERDQFLEKKTNKLRDYILNDQELIVELISSADIDVIKDLTRTLQLSPSFDDMDKRSLLARIVKAYPAVQSLISSEHVKQDTNLLVTWSSLERRKNEYHELVEKKIPANARDIALARSYGDLRENHEYKAAKEAQKVLMRRKGELERDLGRARGTDFSNPKTDVVSPGCKVGVVELAGDHHETFTILGAWDFDIEKGIISYLSPIAQSLLNKAVGDEAEFEFDGVRNRYRIERIEAATLPAPAPAPDLEASETATPEAAGSTPTPATPQSGAPVASETSAPQS
ncbi:MAG: GreA/GreB family elongation factor [Verrucomicrobiales bacterium]|nr:GreA/GreB family elongation factor [Verrucomicrobiales bacterium]